MKVGHRITALRERRGLSQAALAERAGISRMHLSRVGADTVSPTLDMLERIAKALGVHVRDLLPRG
jgi:transcriptional regulator with XRE-family HTH domain